MGILFVIVGVLAMAAGVFANTFYVADILSLTAYKNKQKMPTRLARFLFILVGILFAALGIKFLLQAP